MSTTENNKLIAEFMGWKEQTDPTERFFGSFREPNGVLHKNTPKEPLLFHISWEWLMPVVEKIESIEIPKGNSTDYYDVWIMPDCVRIGLQSNEDEPLIIVNKSEAVGSIDHEIHLFEDKREATYKAVVEFIKWYNENKSDA